MLLRHLSLLLTLMQLVLQDSGASDGDDTDATEDRDGAGDTQNTEGRERTRKGDRDEALSRMGKQRDDARERAEAAEKRAKDAEDRLTTLERDAKKRAEAEAAEQGKWQELAEQREADLATATTERDTYKAQLDEALAAIRADIDATWKDTPEEVRELYEGDADDVLAKRKHLTRSAKLIQRLTADRDRKRGNGPDPDPSTKTLNISEEAAKARSRGGYRI